MSSDDSELPKGAEPPEDRPAGAGGPDEDAGLLDSLLKAFDDREKRAAQSAGGGKADPYDDSDYVWAQPSEDSDLLDAAEGETESEPQPRITATDDSSDIDALIKVAIGSPGDDAPVEDETESLNEDEDAAYSDVVVDENEIDETVFEELSEAAADIEDTSSIDEPLVPSDVEESEDIPAVSIEDDAEPSSAPEAEVADAEAAESEDWLTDLKPEEPLAPVEDAPEAAATPGSAGGVEPLTTEEMEAVLGEAQVNSENEGEPSFDALFEAEPAAKVVEAEPEVEPVVEEVPSADELAPESREELEPIGNTTVMEDIGSENVAAGAAADVVPVAAKAPAPKAPDPEPVEVATEAPPPNTRPVWLLPSPWHAIREQPLRAAAAIAAFAVVGMSAFAFLAINRYKTVAPLGGIEIEIPLERALRLSAAMMDEHDYSGALGVLESAIAAAPKTDEHYADALFQQLDVQMEMLPAELTRDEADAMHAAIDEAVRDGRQHRRTAEALVWKAEVYEREGNFAAARAEYRGILEDYGNAPNRDEVLLRLGQLELKTERPMQAVQIARQVLAEYPRSMYRPEAELLLGDASVAAGDVDGARTMYIRLAENEMDSPIGAEAFERIAKMDLEAGQPGSAIRELQSRLKSATTVEGNERVYLALARAYRASGEPGEARNILNELIDFFPESETTPLALVELSQVLTELGMKDEAVRLSERTVERFPTHPDVLKNAGALYEGSGAYREAGDAYTKAYDAGATTADVLLSAGHAYDLADMPALAQGAFERVVEQYPSGTEAIEAQIGWARAALALGDVDAAYTRLNEVAAVTEGRPRQLPVLRALAGLYGELGLSDAMVATYAKVGTVTDEPGPLAEASRALIEANAVDDGLAVARRVEFARLTPAEVYPFLMAWGRAMLRGDSELAIDLLQRAHDDYPEQRTAEGVELLMRAVLMRGKTAQARATLAELKTRAETTRDAGDRAWLASAAASYGDFLLSRRDYAAAAEAFASASAAPGTNAEDTPPSETEFWNAYQQANALFALGRVDESLQLLDFIGRSPARVARDARVRADTVRLEQRRVAGPPPEDGSGAGG